MLVKGATGWHQAIIQTNDYFSSGIFQVTDFNEQSMEIKPVFIDEIALSDIFCNFTAIL